MTALQESQIITEALLSVNARLAASQLAIEALLDGNPSLDFTQQVIEVLMDPGPANLDCNQVVIEVLMDIPSEMFLVGIPTAETFGAPDVLGNTDVFLTGIPSAEAFGNPTVIRDNFALLFGIASAESFGSQALEPGNVDVAAQAIDSEEAFGEQVLDLDGQLTGIPSAETFGTITVEAIALASISKGTARCLAGDNIIKTQEEAVSAKPKIMRFKGEEPQPNPKLSSYRYVHNPTWCEFKKGQSCVNGAVLPTITIKNMKGKLPPKDRGSVAVSGLGSTQSS